MTTPDDGSLRRRAHPRIPLRARVAMEFTERRCLLAESAINLSAGGMFVRSEAPREPGERFHFELRLTAEGPVVPGVGEVAWVRAADGGSTRPMGFGARFLDLAEGSREMIGRLTKVYLEEGFDALKRELGAAGSAPEGEDDDTVEIDPVDASSATGASPAAEDAPTARVAVAPEVVAGSVGAERREAGGANGQEGAGAASTGGAEAPGPGRWPIWVLLISGGIAAAAAWWLWGGPGREGAGVPVEGSPRPAAAAASVVEPSAPDEAIAAAELEVTGPPAPVAPDPTTAFGEIAEIVWHEDESGVLVELRMDGYLPPGSYRHARLEGPDDTREVIRIFGVARRFPATTLEVGTPLLRRIRTGYHTDGETGEQRVVLDLASREARVDSVETDGTGLLVRVTPEG